MIFNGDFNCGSIGFKIGLLCLCHGWVAINVNSMAGEPKLCLLCLSHGWIAINVNCMAVSWLDSH